MTQPSFEEISAIHADFRDHITDATHAEFNTGVTGSRFLLLRRL